MHILFCTGAKHAFGIKMCTPVSISSLNITAISAYSFFPPPDNDDDLIRWLRSLAEIPFHKKSLP